MTNGMFPPVGLKSPAAFLRSWYSWRVPRTPNPKREVRLFQTVPFDLAAQSPALADARGCFSLSFTRRIVWRRFRAVVQSQLGLRIKAVHWPLKPWEMERYHQPQPGPGVFGACFFQNPLWRNWQSRKAQTFHVVGSNPSDGTTPSSPIGSGGGFKIPKVRVRIPSRGPMPGWLRSQAPSS